MALYLEMEMMMIKWESMIQHSNYADISVR